MTESKTSQCLNCGQTEAEAPMVLFHYQGRELWVCADCLPVMIHKRPLLMEKWATSTEAPAKEG